MLFLKHVEVGSRFEESGGRIAEYTEVLLCTLCIIVVGSSRCTRTWYFLCTGYPYPVPYYTVYNLNRVHNFVELGGGVGGGCTGEAKVVRRAAGAHDWICESN